MAKFSEVMRQWDRMCKSIGVHDRVECPLVHAFDIPNCESCYDYALGDSSQTEEIVMAWAADHPEPVYPTWAEWLMEHGLVFAGDSPYFKRWFVINQSRIEKPIPADIAEKLGIKPKGET